MGVSFCGSISMNRDLPTPAARVGDFLDRLVRQGDMPGIQYLVVTADSIVARHVAGVRDARGALPVERRTTFLSASSTKALTAAGVLLLVERGRLTLADPLSTFVPEHPYGSAITIRQLLNHSSGVPNPIPVRWLHTAAEHLAFDENEALQRVLTAHGSLDFEPGARYGYSNIGYWLLGKVIERVTGRPYCEFMRTDVFTPLGIPAEEMSCAVVSADSHARGHQRRFSWMAPVFWLMADRKVWAEAEGPWSRFEILYMNGPAYGGINATADAYGRFLQDLLRPQPRLFSSRTRDLLFSPQRDNSGHLLPSTLGWKRGMLAGIEFFEKPGGGPGCNSNIRLYPRAGIGTVYLANATGVSEGDIQRFSDKLDREFLTGRASR